MKRFYYNTSILLFFIFTILFVGCYKFSNELDPDPDPEPNPEPHVNTYISSSKIKIIFSVAPELVNISIPPLKYNKDFCIGLHLDDGAEDIYTHAYQLLNGGKIDGLTYPGLSFTDGCGNDIKFKMSTAIFSLDIDEIIDIHEPGLMNGFLTWPQIIEMYKSDWGVYNHGLTIDATIDHSYSIESNHNYVKSKTTDAFEGGINMKIFVNPDGDPTFSDYAFQQNYRISFVAGYEFCNPYFDITNTWNKSNIKMGRTLLVSQVNFSQLVDEVAELSINGSHYWMSTFTHSVTNNNWGYNFNMFKDHMTYIANKYGKNGFDNILMVSEEEMLDYCILKDLLVLNQNLNDNILEITFSGNIPSDLRFYNTSLILSTNTTILSIEIEGASQSSSYNGINTNSSLININCNNL